MGALRGPGDEPLGEDEGDAEGLALAGGDGLFVSFERMHRVWNYQSPAAPAKPLLPFPNAAWLRNNAGLEALAIDAEGTLYAIPERPPRGKDHVPVYRFRDGAWSVAGTLAPGRFRPTGADIGPDGRLYLLERAWLPPLSFATRATRWRIDAEALTDPELLLETPYGHHDNLEGIAVWRAPDGALRMLLVADDNNLALQRTEVVEYALPE